MSNNNPTNDKKTALLAYKEKILKDIQYYDKRIDDFRANQNSNCYYDDADSSDSDDCFPDAVDLDPKVPQLKLQREMLKTCLHATQELTSLTVLQSEVNVLVQDPQLDGERPVTEAGTWKEVTAECRIDLVPFTITFYMHTPNRKFAPMLYRGLQISLIKSAHEVELNQSMIHSLKTPSDAIEVVRSYAVGHRSRRTTLARLANKYGSSLFMEPHPEGGFVLKCGNLLEILWRLENKWSQVAPFHHRMKFDLEYMDESYIKIITQAHKQLLDPSIQTDERTLLLSKIIATCLEARGPVDSESDLESRQTSVQLEAETKDKDSEVMAPPKSLPKKTKKVVAKDNNANKDLSKDRGGAQKRGIEDENKEDNAKKIKTNEEGGTKKSLKAKEKTGEVKNYGSNKKVKSSDVGGLKKKPSEDQDLATKKKNDKFKKTDKNKQNENANGNNIDENNKNATNTNIANKRKTDNVQEDLPKAITNEGKGPKKTKNNEENKRKNVESIESNPKKVKNSNIVSKKINMDENNKIVNNNINTAKKNKHDNDQVEVQKTNKNDEFDKAKTNEEIKKTNGEKVESVPKKVKNNANKTDRPTKNNEDIPAEVINSNENDEPGKNNIDKEKKNNLKDNDNAKKIDRKTKMSIANDNKFDQITKKISILNKNVEKNQVKNIANSKNAIKNKNNEIVDDNKDGDNKKIKNIEKKTIANTKNAESKQNTNNKPKSTEMVKNKNPGNTKDVQTVTEKNATNFKNKDKISNVNIVHEKPLKDKPIAKTDKIVTNEIQKINKKLTKIVTKSVRDIMYKSPKNKNPLKSQNTQKATNARTSNGNTKIFSGNTEKENGGKISKIPQKRISSNSENTLKTNMLRISPRVLPSKFKTISKDPNTKQMMKATNIPRLMKRPQTTQ